jgi:spermidine dehydrogenase
MAKGITRRDFLDGVALAMGAGLTPAKLLAASPERYYPPALTGLRGHHPGAFEIAHRRAWQGELFDAGGGAADESYDLIVVGAGISGLAAAWFYRQRHEQARILILDNHDDFGGHAKRNEFRAGSRLILAYGGSETLESPKAQFSDTVNGLLQDLGIDLARFETAFERDLYPSLGLARAVFFDRESFGQDKLVVGDAQIDSTDEIPPGRLNARPVETFVADFPMSEEAKKQLVRLYTARIDYLAGMSRVEKEDYLRHTSYHDYLTDRCGLGAEAVKYFQARSHDYFALGIDAVSAWVCREEVYPGFDGLNLEADEEAGEAAAAAEPYIHHFPDGNASVARLLVRSLIREVAPGSGMEDIVLADFDYAQLDRDGAPVRIRLNSVVVHVRHPEGPVEVVYVDAGSGRVRKAQARHCVLACFHAMIPYLLPELPPEQKEALAACVRAPLVYTKVSVREWRAFAALGVHEIYAPMAFHALVKLDYPVSLGGYRHARSPDEPIGLHMVHVPTAPHQGLSAREQFRAGRARLLEMSFADFEDRIRDQLDRMLGGGGFRSGRDVAAITVNRWSHGYAYYANSLYDPEYEEGAEPFVLARRRAGNVTIANSDAAWDAYAHTAIDQAARAVAELPRG